MTLKYISITNAMIEANKCLFQLVPFLVMRGRHNRKENVLQVCKSCINDQVDLILELTNSWYTILERERERKRDKRHLCLWRWLAFCNLMNFIRKVIGITDCFRFTKPFSFKPFTISLTFYMKKYTRKKKKCVFDERIPYGIKQHSFITILH